MPLKKIEKYYTTQKHLENLFEKNARMMAVKKDSLDELQNWQIESRNKLKELLHQEYFEKCELLPEIIEDVDFKTFIRKKIVIQTEPEVFMPFFLLCPKDMNNVHRHPAVLFSPGHGPGKLITAQATDYEEVLEFYEQNGQKPDDLKEGLPIRFVKEGYFVLIPETRGAGERRELWSQGSSYEKFNCNNHGELNKIAISLGYSIMGMNIWDMGRAIDYIETMENYDGRLCCGGHSGGGHLSIYLSAIDTRIQMTFTSGYYYGFQDAFLHLPQNCSCNYVPDLWRYFDICDIGCMIAPRPLLIESGDEDYLNGPLGLGNVYPQVLETRQAYQKYKCEDKLVHTVYHGTHADGLSGNEVADYLMKYMPC